MNIQILTSEKATIIVIEGRIVLGRDVENMKKEVMKILNSGEKKIIIDLKNVTFLDSSGLGAFALLHKTIDSAGGKLVLSSLSPQISRMVEITGLNEILNIFKSTKQATEELS